VSTVPRAIVTRRLRLEATGPAHADGMWSAVESSQREIRPWMAWAIAPTLEDTLAFVVGAEREWDRGTSRNFTILLDREVIGSVGINRVEPVLLAAQVGYWLRTDHNNRGYMTEAASATVEFAFAELGLHRLELHAAPDNRASARVAQKLGFRREGLLRDGARGVGGWHDVDVYGLLASDERPRLH